MGSGTQLKKMTNLPPIQFEGKKGRVVIENGTPWFAAKDVAIWLDYPAASVSQMNNLTAKVPKEWKGHKRFLTPGGEQNLLALTLEGFNFFVIRSDKPKALPLQKFVSGEVLPQIYSAGSYISSSNPTGTEESLRFLDILLDEENKSLRKEKIKACVSLMKVLKSSGMESDTVDRLCRYYNGAPLTYKEIAKLMDVSESTVTRWANWLCDTGMLLKRRRK